MPKNYHITRGNFVAPDPVPPRVEILAPTDLPPAPIPLPMPHSSHTDRSLGFTLVTAPLAGVVSLVAVLVAILGFRVPMVSLAALLCALAGFALVWLISFIVFTFVSPDGALFLYTILVFRLLFIEAKERRNRYGKR